MVKTFEDILSNIDSRMKFLEDKGVSPKIIILGKVNFYTFAGYHKLDSHPDVKTSINTMNSNVATSEFYYKELPIFFSNTLHLPGDGEFVNVYGE
jgi:hypothetical protein